MSVKHSHLYAVILAGGSGTRFWPLSRALFPKQLLQVVGGKGDGSLLQQTVRRALRVVSARCTCVVTSAAQADAVRLQLSDWHDALVDNVVLEPEGRNTAPAIGLAALWLLRRDADATMLVLPADHVVKGDRAFRQAVSLGYQLAQQGNLVTFGIHPTTPNTGYGYIQPNRRSCVGRLGALSGYAVERFVEKPDLKRARLFLKAGGYVWNSGMFMWRVDALLEAYARHQPGLIKALRAIDTMMQAGQPADRIARHYRRLESVSIDYGVMERSSRTAVVPVDFVWSDIGTWSSLNSVAHRDRRGNVVRGNVVDLDSERSVLWATKRLVGTVGLSDMVVVDTPDATLVCPKSRSQDVKTLVDMLRKRAAPEQLEHVVVYRPWGSYTVLEEQSGHKVKRICVLPGQRLSLQMHYQRSEHWVVIAGTARVTRGRTVFDVGQGEHVLIPKRTKHRLENQGMSPLEIIEVQSGAYLGEDDIVRYHDDYGRSARHVSGKVVP